MKVAVGSENPIKIEAVRLAFNTVWPSKKCEILGVKVSSGVADQPMTNKESVKGATNRAKSAIKALNADFGVGLEGGIEKIGSVWLEWGYMAVINIWLLLIKREK
jgi:inosine/xanthosine triphosphatase